MMRNCFAILWVWMICVAGCGEPTSVEIFGYDQVEKTLVRRIVRLPEDVSPESLSSSKAVLMMGNTLEVNPGAYGCTIAGLPCESPSFALRNKVAEIGGTSPRLRYDVKSKVLYPLDYETYTMAAVSYYLHSAMHLHELLGFTSTDWAPIYVYPSITGLLSLSLPVSDNASYLQPLDGFVVFRASSAKEVPLTMNSGVLFHEYHHRSFNEHIYLGSLPKLLAEGTTVDPQSLAQHRLKALDEGIADFFGAYGASAPDFLEWGSSSESLRGRNLSEPKVFQSAWLSGQSPMLSPAYGNAKSYDPYTPGAVFSYYLWSLQDYIPIEDIAQLWMRTEVALGNKLNGRLQEFTFAMALSLFVEALGSAFPETLTRVCERSYEAFPPLRSALSRCP